MPLTVAFPGCWGRWQAWLLSKDTKAESACPPDVLSPPRCLPLGYTERHFLGQLWMLGLESRRKLMFVK